MHVVSISTKCSTCIGGACSGPWVGTGKCWCNSHRCWGLTGRSILLFKFVLLFFGVLTLLAALLSWQSESGNTVTTGLTIFYLTLVVVLVSLPRDSGVYSELTEVYLFRGRL
ncbi:hypothetical protein M427DRAFT_366046 [Gonapodya prolifera JEL478]|uniref:Uncharacterized protein n=1 Tax=Gonapodya prolifera (strain JEL478) TaxID=1344416 RepID=A0A139AA40_GONPJ|nr:hypothetical protein M427DRAFT_366046 [Gonapodya prolifera JEL478]|eukprot:KXS13656.1 hypothetical protein M427DRAFT_366046 [Gonapodya prolifera JEL478]